LLKEPSIWIAIDHKTGNANQAIAVAKSIGKKFETKTLTYNFLGLLPNRLKFNSLIGINLHTSSDLNPPYPDIIISSGRKTAIVSKIQTYLQCI
jgi:mitochondrial fission protein ELM1